MNVITRWHNTALVASYDSVTLWHCDNVTWPSTEIVGETVLIKHEDFDVEGASDNTWSNIWVLSPGLSCPAMTVKVCHDSPPPPTHCHDWLLILSRVKLSFPSAYNYLAGHKLISFQHSQSESLPVTNQPLTIPSPVVETEDKLSL